MPATDNFFRDLKGMHVVFAVSAVALFGVTIWMLAVDHSEEWHDYQKAQFRIDAERLQRASKEVKTPEYNAAIKQLNENRSQAKARLEEQGAELGELQSELASLDRDLDLANRETKDRRQYRDVARANYDLGISVQADEETLAGYKKAFEEQKSLVDAAELDLQQKQSAYDEALFRLKQEQSETEEIEANLKQLTADSERIRKALNVIQPENKFSRFKRNMMEWPIIDGFNSHLRIQQDWLPDLKIKLGMAETARFDRCRTCHQSVDVVEAGNVPAFPFGHPSSDSIGNWFDEKAFPHPFATHPNPALYLTAASPHPVARFGCTICHEGQGSGTDFSNAAHYPNDPYQHEEWEHEFHFATNHYWEYPMLPKRFEESSCLKCHHKVVELGVNPTFGASAPKVYDGFQLVRQFGCFGCHQINGFQGNVSIGPDIRLEPATEAEAKIIADDPGRVAGTMRKVGPALRHIESKTTPSFVEYWTEEPKRFRPATRMPQFFDLTNQHDEVAKRLQPVEIAALTQYLFAKSEPLELMQPAEAYQPDTGCTPG